MRTEVLSDRSGIKGTGVNQDPEFRKVANYGDDDDGDSDNKDDGWKEKFISEGTGEAGQGRG